MTGTTLSTHVLDLENGRPAAGMTVELVASFSPGRATRSVTDADGRIRAWDPDVVLEPGTWSLLFHAGPWYQARGIRNFHPVIPVQFHVDGDLPHLHVPLLLNRFGYSTYRGS